MHIARNTLHHLHPLLALLKTPKALNAQNNHQTIKHQHADRRSHISQQPLIIPQIYLDYDYVDVAEHGEQDQPVGDVYLKVEQQQDADC